MSADIIRAVDELPTNSLTVRALKALDFIAPGQWQNLVGFDNTIRAVTGETDETVIYQCRARCEELYNDKSQGYQRALWLYQTVDSTDKALGAAALANKVGERVSFLGFLNRITPKADKAQSIDLSIKLVSEVVCFTLVNGLPGDSIGDFVAALSSYEKESLIRMAALIAFDGLIPLGPDFLDKVLNTVGSMGPNELAQNGTFQRVQSLIPGGDTAGQLGFINTSLNSVQGWMRSFISERGITQSAVLNNLRGFVDASDDKLDYLAGFLDLSTNYFEHTGTQLLARSLIERAIAEI
jgi:hypothetical protein